MSFSSLMVGRTIFDLTRLSFSAERISRYWYVLVKATIGLLCRYLKAYGLRGISRRHCDEKR